MKRGFKAHAESLATELRSETGTPLLGAFDPFAFSSMYGIPVVKLSELEGPERDYLLGSGNDVFSGMLIPNRSGVVILINDSHSIQRQRATLCHEIAHFVLEHPFEISFSADRSCGLGGEYEEEAVWLGASMLIPKEAAFELAYRNCSDDEVASRYNVSIELARWRMNITGARIRARMIHKRYMRESE